MGNAAGTCILEALERHGRNRRNNCASDEAYAAHASPSALVDGTADSPA
jgi:hypothetical protein